jgi:16S rRNA G966 N2-methylase RsmD
VLRENVVSLGIEDRTVVELGAAATLIPRYKAGIVFLDPPYDRESEYGKVLDLMGENPPELVIAQHSARLTLAEACGQLVRTRVVRQGDNALSFFVAQGHTRGLL